MEQESEPDSRSEAEQCRGFCLGRDFLEDSCFCLSFLWRLLVVARFRDRLDEDVDVDLSASESSADLRLSFLLLRFEKKKIL